MTTRLNYLILCLLLILGIPIYWLFYERNPGDAQPKGVSVLQLRALSNAISGTRPSSIRYEAITTFERSRNLIATGLGLRENKLFILAYKLEYVDREPILIGSGISRAQSVLRDYERYSPSAQAQVNSALNESGHVIALDDSPGQIGGLEALGNSENALDLKDDLEKQWQRDVEGKPYALAPGVVVIPAGEFQDHRRLVYVRLANGREYLFAGPIAPILQSWRDLRPPARIVTNRMEPNNREELFSWLMTLQELRRQAPRLTIVSGYRVPAKSGIIRQFANDSDR